MTSLLHMRDVWKSFHGVPVLRAAQLDVRRGEVHALVGENGAGKSTLLAILAGALAADRGEVLLEGQPLPRGPHAVLRRGVHLIWQEFHLVPWLSIADNVFLGSEKARAGVLQAAHMRRAASEILRSLGSARPVTTPVAALSVAEQQLVEIARALAHEVRVLAMDEPSAALTPREVAALMTIVRELRDRGVGIVWVTHRLEEVSQLCDRVTILRDGQWVSTDRAAAVSRAEIVRRMVGRDEVRELPPRAAPPGEIVLEVERLSRGDAYRDVSFTLRRGEILGLAGLVGSGRSALAMGLCGNPPPEHGVVRRRGRPVQVRDPRHALALGIGLLAEDRKLLGIVPARPVRENMSLASLGAFSRAGIVRTRAERQAVAVQQQRLGIRATSLEQPIRSLSGGNQQKALLARLLATDAEVLLFDEPTRGIDVGAKADVWALLDELARAGKAVLMISSDLPEVLALADRVGVMRDGRLVAILARGEATPERVMSLATGTIGTRNTAGTGGRA